MTHKVKAGIRHFKISDLDELQTEGSHLGPIEEYTEKIKDQSRIGEVYTAIGKDGLVLAIGGIIEFWQGYGESWVIYSKRIKKNLRDTCLITNAFLNRILAIKNYRRIEANCRDSHKQCKFLEKLGFKIVAIRKKYFPDGGDGYLYEMVR
jgi:hypothetical protein